MKNFLLVTEIFAPYFCPRHGAMCKYIQESGWQACHVITMYRSWYDGMKDFSFFEGVAPVTEVHQPLCHKGVSAWLNKITAPFRILWGMAPYEKAMFIAGERIIKQGGVDLIVISASDFVTQSPNIVGYYLAKKYNIPYVMDIRDIEEQRSLNTKKKWRGLRCEIEMNIRRKQCWRNAKALISVSKWQRDYLTKYNKSSFNIYNGYEPELFKKISVNSDHFSILFAGTIEDSGNMDFEMFFRCVGDLVSSGKIKKENLRLNLYIKTKQHALVLNECLKYNLTSNLHLQTRIPFNEMPKVMAQNSVVLVFTAKGINGVRTTKLFEYMAMGRPVLCVRSDENEMENIIRETAIGCAARSDKEACDFLLAKYHEWEKLGTTLVEGNEEAIEMYSRQKQATKFAEIFNNVIKND